MIKGTVTGKAFGNTVTWDAEMGREGQVLVVRPNGKRITSTRTLAATFRPNQAELDELHLEAALLRINEARQAVAVARKRLADANHAVAVKRAELEALHASRLNPGRYVTDSQGKGHAISTGRYMGLTWQTCQCGWATNSGSAANYGADVAEEHLRAMEQASV